MNTVKGARGKRKVLLTMIFRKTSFMLIILMNDGTRDSVIQVFDVVPLLQELSFQMRVPSVIILFDPFKSPFLCVPDPAIWVIKKTETRIC